MILTSHEEWQEKIEGRGSRGLGRHHRPRDCRRQTHCALMPLVVFLCGDRFIRSSYITTTAESWRRRPKSHEISGLPLLLLLRKTF